MKIIATILAMYFFTIYAEHIDQNIKATARPVLDLACQKEVKEIFDTIESTLPKVVNFELPKVDEDDEKSLDFYFKNFYEPKTDAEKATAVHKLTDRSGKPTIYFSKLLLDELKKENPDKKNLIRYSKIIKNTALGNDNPLIEEVGTRALVEYLKKFPDKEMESLLPKDTNERIQYVEIKDRKKDVNNLEIRIGLLNTLPKDKKLEHLNGLAKKLDELSKTQDFISCHGGKIHNQYDMIRKAIFAQDILEDFLFLNQPGRQDLEKILKVGDYYKLETLAQKYFYSVYGLKADFYHTTSLLKKGHFLLASARIEQALSNLNILIKKAKDPKIKTEYEKFQNQFYLLGAIAFKKAGDEGNVKLALERLAPNTELAKNINISSQKIANASKCVQPLSGDELFRNYHNHRNPEDTLVINAPYIHSMLQKRVPDINQKNLSIERYFKDGFDPTLLNLNTNEELQLDFCHPRLTKTIFHYGDSSKENILLWALVVSLRNPEIIFRNRAHIHLKKMGIQALPALPKLIENLDSHFTTETKNYSKDIILEFKEKAVPELIKALKNPSFDIRYHAVNTLGLLGPHAHQAIPALIEYLHTHLAYTNSTIDSIALIGEKAVPELLKALKKTGDSRRVALILCLAKIGERAHSAVPTLISLLKDKDKEVVRTSIYALGNIGEASEAAVPTLKEFLHYPDFRDVLSSIITLGKIGSKSKNVVPDLVAILKDSKKSHYHNAILEALGNIGEDIPAFLPMVIEATKDKSEAYKIAAIAALGKLGKKDSSTLPPLIDLVKNGNFEEKIYAVKALGTAGEKAISTLGSVLIDELNPEVQLEAAKSLRSIGEKAVPTLIQALKSKDATASRLAAQTLGNLGIKAKTAIPALKDYEKHLLEKPKPTDFERIYLEIAKEAIAAIEMADKK